MRMLHRSIWSKVKVIMMPHYASLVRPHLEYLVQVGVIITIKI